MGTSRDVVTLEDKLLLEGAANGLTGEELQDKYGVPAAEAIVRVRRMLQARDVFDDLEQKKLLMVSLFRVKRKVEAAEADMDVEDPKVLEAYLKLIQTMNLILRDSGKLTDAELEAAAKAQAKQMLLLIDMAYGRVRHWLEEEYGQVLDVRELDQRFQTALQEVVIEDE